MADEKSPFREEVRISFTCFIGGASPRKTPAMEAALAASPPADSLIDVSLEQLRAELGLDRPMPRARFTAEGGFTLN